MVELRRSDAHERDGIAGSRLTRLRTMLSSDWAGMNTAVLLYWSPIEQQWLLWVEPDPLTLTGVTVTDS